MLFAFTAIFLIFNRSRLESFYCCWKKGGQITKIIQICDFVEIFRIIWNCVGEREHTGYTRAPRVHTRVVLFIDQRVLKCLVISSLYARSHELHIYIVYHVLARSCTTTVTRRQNKSKDIFWKFPQFIFCNSVPSW